MDYSPTEQTAAVEAQRTVQSFSKLSEFVLGLQLRSCASAPQNSEFAFAVVGKTVYMVFFSPLFTLITLLADVTS